MNGFEKHLQPALRESGLPGIVCAAAGPQELLDLTSVGHVDFGSPQRMSLDTSFWIASITKLATAVAVLQLVEREQLRLEAEVADYLPFFCSLEVLTKPGLVPATARVGGVPTGLEAPNRPQPSVHPRGHRHEHSSRSSGLGKRTTTRTSRNSCSRRLASHATSSARSRPMSSSNRKTTSPVLRCVQPPTMRPSTHTVGPAFPVRSKMEAW